MRPGTVVELARRNGIPLPSADPTQLYRYTSLDTFLQVFWLVQSTLGRREDWARLAYESVVDGAAHGLVYRETFFTPARHLAGGQDLADIVAGLVERLAELCRAGAAGTARVIGVGLDSTEKGVDPAQFAEAFALAGDAGLHRTSHQGEETPPSYIEAGLDVLGCERIDHGLSSIHDAELSKRLADQRIPLTVCPNSNVVIANAVPRLELHPYRRMREAGLLATLNTDDPALTDLDLGREYFSVLGAFDYTWDDMVQISVDGVEATWLDEDSKRTLIARVEKEGAELGTSIQV